VESGAALCYKSAVTILRIRCRTAALLAVASMLLNAAWPVLANAKPYFPDLPQETCSATGLVHANGGAPVESPHKSLYASHCTLCPFGAERGAAITPVAGLLFLPTLASPRVARAEAPRLHLAHHPAAPPRAPPVLS
jgi:hypothetical protein